MKIGIPKERQEGELRAAATADTIKRYKGLGLEPVVERGAGAGAAIGDVGRLRPAAARAGGRGRRRSTAGSFGLARISTLAGAIEVRAARHELITELDQATAHAHDHFTEAFKAA